MDCGADGRRQVSIFLIISDNLLTRSRHKYTLFLSLDGNFKQQLKIKNCDQDDIELFIAFFARKATFDAYIQSCKSNVEVGVHLVCLGHWDFNPSRVEIDLCKPQGQ